MAPRIEARYDNIMKHESDKTRTWERNAPSQIALNSIFAALSGALIVIIVQGPQATTWEFASLLLLTCAFFFFAISAEQTVNALDERDVAKYAYYMLPYNCGVIFLGVAIELLAYVRFNPWLLLHVPSRLSFVAVGVWFVLPVLFLWTWLKDSVTLFRAGNEEFESWLKELQDEQEAAPDHSIFMRTFYNVRKRIHG